MSELQKPQSWQNCDKDVKDFVTGLASKLEAGLGDNLVGIYLQGSLAMGSYYRPKSDIDLIIVVQNKLGPDTRKSVTEMIANHATLKPTTGNIELSIVLAATAKTIPVPVPFEVHYSTGWHDKIMTDDVDYTEERTDIDLQSHFAYVVQRGIVLQGKPIHEIFGEIDWQAFMDGVMDDFRWIVEDEHITETPFYCVLNICRVLQLLSENNKQVHSKDEGGEWALQHLPKQYHMIIRRALDAYRSPKQVDESQRRTNGEVWDKEALLAFRDYARSAA